MNILEKNYNFTLNEEISGSAVATVVGVEMIVAISANMFILVFTLYHPKILKQPSIIFLTNFIIINLLMASTSMHSTLITAAAGEWVFGDTIEEKHISCQLFAFTLTNILTVSALGLTIISVDRFVFIVKPLAYKHFMKPKTAALITISIWVTACLLSVPPFFGLGRYGFSDLTVTCVALWRGQKAYALFITIVLSLCAITVIVTTLWTFCFTRQFINRMKSCQTSSSSIIDIGFQQNHVYNRQAKRVIGMFGVLLIVNCLTFIPPVFVAALVAIGFDIPEEVITATFILFFSNNILNPVVQSYFRKELKDFIVKYCKKVFRKLLCRYDVNPTEVMVANSMMTDFGKEITSRNNAVVHVQPFNSARAWSCAI